MNKIYKVVWSKVKHCYVVTSELAKRQTKGCGARSLRTATVSLGVAAALLCTGAVLPVFGESVAEAKTTTTKQGNKIINATVDFTTAYNFQYPEEAVTISATEINAVTNAYGVFGNVAQRMGKQTMDSVSFKVVDGQLIEVHNVTMSYVVDDKNPYQRVLVGHPFNFSNYINRTDGNFLIATDAEIDDEIKNSAEAKADVSGYTVTMTGGSLQEVTGGLSNGGKVSNNTVNLNGGTAYKVYGGYTVGGAAETNHVVLNGGIAGVSGTIVSGGELYGAYSYNDSGNSGNVTGNTVTVDKSGIVMAPVYGGSTEARDSGNASGNAVGNIVTIKDGTLAGNIYGGYSYAENETSGNVEGNQVIIQGGVLKSAPVTINGTNYNTVGVWNIYGGYTYGYDNDTDTNASGIAKDNEVTISGGTLRDDVRVIGGHSNGNHAEHNTVTITNAYTGTVGTVIGGEAQLAATKNEVAINGGTAKGNVLGALSYAGAAGGDSAAAGNKAAVDSAVVEGNLIGGWSRTGNASYNTVTVKGSTSKIGNASNDNVAPVIGGLSGYFGASISSDAPNSGDAKNNTVTIENGNIDGSIYGGASITHTSKTSGDVTGNKVQINGGKVLSSVYGGYNHSGSADKTASNNEVTMDGGSADEVYGGWSLLGKAAQNTVTLNSGAEAGKVYGGWGGATAEKNEVIINGGTVRSVVFGGGGAIWYNSTATGVETATGNTVTVKDGTVKNVTGGSGIDSAENNTVIIEKTGKVSNTIVGGDSATGNIKNNTVTIKGGTIGNLVYAAQYAKGSKGTITDNVINLTGNVTLGTYVHLRGYEDYNRSSDEVPNHSGNDLHVGGIKGGAAGVWQGRNSEGTVTNTVASVAKFDTIVYHSVKWDENVAALAATTVENIGAIDINDLTFDSASATGTMALLKATGDGADLSAIKLNYSGGSGVAITTGGVVIGGATPTTETDGVNGVKLTSTSSDKVLLASEKNAINYAKGASTVSGITFGTFDKAEAARSLTGVAFAGTNTIDAADLQFKATSDALKKNDSITLLTTSATGMATAVANGTGKTIAINNYKDAQGIVFGATATGTVTSTGSAVNYSVGSVDVNTINLAGWTGTTSDLTTGDLSGWAGTGVAVATGDMANADLSDLNPGDTKPILTAGSEVTFTDDNISGNKKWQSGGTITDTDTSGVSVTGTTTGGGVKVDDTNKNVLVYQKDAKTIMGITLGSVAFTKDGKVRSFDNSYNLTGADFTTTGFGISNASTATMNAGDTMVVVDAVNAIKGTSDATLQDFTTTNAGDAIAFTDQIEGKALTLSGTHQDTLEQNEAKNQILYKVGDKNVTAAIFTGEVAWNDSEAYYDAAKGTAIYKFAAVDFDAENLKVTGETTKELKTGDAMTLLSATGMTAGTVTDQSEASKTASKVAVNYKDDKGIALAAEAKGEVKAEADAVKYNINEVKLTDVDLSAWTGTESAVPETWTAEDGSVKVATGSFAAPEVGAGTSKNILTAGGAFFADENISGANKYDEANGK
ncbi:MAG: ESPR domain-containing protein, partial [Acidaminococcaceae bacterium]|nr:ESPR domain-containing protein [Acidaminococcaceae bacterium]